MDCTICGDVIPQGRLEALPDTITCVKCSQERAKTVDDIEIDGTDPLDLQRSVAAPDRESR